MAEPSVEDPQENPSNTGHLPVSGEVGNGPVSYHDPLTQDTTDDIAIDDGPRQASSQTSADNKSKRS
jgi:hypothetical protein